MYFLRTLISTYILDVNIVKKSPIKKKVENFRKNCADKIISIGKKFLNFRKQMFPICLQTSQ